MRRLCVVDLEATCWEDRAAVANPRNEIIEVGAVMADLSDGLPELSRFRAFVRPTLNPSLSDFCKGLTKIRQEDVDSAAPFPRVCAELEAWASGFGGAVFASWGRYDKSQLLMDCELHSCRYPFAPDHLNLKDWVAGVLGCKPRGLRKMLEHQAMSGLAFEGEQHRALTDAAAALAVARRAAAVAGVGPVADGRESQHAWEAHRLAAGFFHDAAKARAWMVERNPLLGGLSPREMVEAGRGEKLLKFMRQTLEENAP